MFCHCFLRFLINAMTPHMENIGRYPAREAQRALSELRILTLAGISESIKNAWIMRGMRTFSL